MRLYSTLEDVPLPDKIYGPAPLDEKVICLVKALKAQELTTIGSCEGHSDRYTAYPWIQLLPHDDLRLLQLLTTEYNNLRNDPRVQWAVMGNCLRTQEASSNGELYQIHKGIESFSKFLFKYRPEIIDPDYIPLKMPTEIQRKKEDQLSNELNALSELLKTNQESTGVEDKIKEKLVELGELNRDIQLNGYCIQFIGDHKRIDRCLNKMRNIRIDLSALQYSRFIHF